MNLQPEPITTRTVIANVVLYGCAYKLIEGALAKLRKKDDRWNRIMSGATTAGIFLARCGMRRLACSTIFIAGANFAYANSAELPIGHFQTEK